MEARFFLPSKFPSDYDLLQFILPLDGFDDVVCIDRTSGGYRKESGRDFARSSSKPLSPRLKE
jgi:hypothetical protein